MILRGLLQDRFITLSSSAMSFSKRASARVIAPPNCVAVRPSSRLVRNGTKKADHVGRLVSWWLLPDSNWGHKALQASALPTELKSHVFIITGAGEETLTLDLILGKDAL